MIKMVEKVDDDATLEDLWKLYYDAFKDLNTQAVQRHMYHRGEFDEVMRDPRIQKHLCYDDGGALLGVSTYTNDLDAVPLLSPEYFQRRWPDDYAARKIWYIVFVAVHPEAQTSDAFRSMVEQMYLIASRVNGKVGLDICNFNDTTHRMSRVFRAMIRRWHGSSMVFGRIDQQSYWLYEFPDTSEAVPA